MAKYKTIVFNQNVEVNSAHAITCIFAAFMAVLGVGIFVEPELKIFQIVIMTFIFAVFFFIVWLFLVSIQFKQVKVLCLAALLAASYLSFGCTSTKTYEDNRNKPPEITGEQLLQSRSIQGNQRFSIHHDCNNGVVCYLYTAPQSSLSCIPMPTMWFGTKDKFCGGD